MMKKKKLLWQLYPSYLLIVIISLIAVVYYSSKTFKEVYLRSVEKELLSKANLLGLTSRDFLDTEKLNKNINKLGRASGTRLTVILDSGKVIADSLEDPNVMDNHADRPEIKKALAGGNGVCVRYSYTLKKNMMYTAIPLKQNKDIVGVVRTSVSISDLDSALKKIYFRIGFGGFFIVVIAAIVCFFVSRRIVLPLEELKNGANRFAKGDFNLRLPVSNSLEIASLATAMNEMAQKISEQISTITIQTHELEAVFSSMIEGVIAVDSDERFININQTALDMLGIKTGDVRGKHIQELTIPSKIQRVIRETLTNNITVEKEMRLIVSGKECRIKLMGTVLKSSGSKKFGALIVMHDITLIKKLEKMRREFVSNVSHEIKTPLSSIKGFVETLIDENLDIPDQSKRFLDIVLKHVDRLNVIVDDLLMLSRLERDVEHESISFVETNLRGSVESAIRFCKAKADGKKIIINLKCDKNILLKLNTRLFEQAIINLVDNAVKYSNPKSTVDINVVEDVDCVISVHDRGCGINKKHLSRLFERFYRVDTARSRNLGGSGLGLALVKHIVQIHGGSVSVESIPEKGSTFSIILPNI